MIYGVKPSFKNKYFGSQIGSTITLLKTKTLIVKDLEGLRVVPPGLEPGTK